MTAGPCFVIAEAGVNHNGELSLALRLVDAAAAAGADAVKFQTFRTELLTTASAPKAAYQIRQTGGEQSQSEMLKALQLDEPDYREIAAHCRRVGIEFMSTPFDEPSVDMLVSLGVGRLKVSSGDLTNGPLLLRMARTGLPIILSTGMGTLDDIRMALSVIAFGYRQGHAPGTRAFAQAFQSSEGQAALSQHVTLLHCTSDYPTPPADVNLRAMTTIAETFRLPVGYSDHTAGTVVAIGAVARGATVVEKHITLDRSMPGPDHTASLEPGEFTEMVRSVRELEESLGSSEKKPTGPEQSTALVARRSLYASRAIQAGEIFTEAHLACRRPCAGRSPMEYWDLIGTPSARNYAPGEAIE
jgi:N-acetylneuraminate synthase